MSKLKHTAGPWKILNYKDHDHIIANNVDNICEIVLRKNGDYNACLIAAAPEMLEALIQIIKKYIYDGKESRANLFIPLIEKATGLSIEEVLK